MCPSKDGALKKTDQLGWAHVVCALYIPEVRFGNVTTMEPIILQLIPGERFNKVRYYCYYYHIFLKEKNIMFLFVFLINHFLDMLYLRGKKSRK